MFRLVLFILAFCAVFPNSISAESFPADIERCAHSDSECLSKVTTHILRTHYSQGHPGLNIIAFDPIHVKSLVLEKVPGCPVNLEFRFMNFDVSGISQANVDQVSGFTKQPKNLVFEMHVTLPRLVLNGSYIIEGQVLILPLSGEGNSEIILENSKAVIKAKCSTVQKGGKTYLHILDAKLNLQPEGVIFNLENLLNGDKVVVDVMNHFLNKNWEVVYAELKPLVDKTLAKVAMEIAEGTFSKYPYSELFLEPV